MSTKNTVIDYFRCPEQLFCVKARHDSSSEPGYFRVGDQLLLYGRLAKSAVSSTPISQLTDAAPTIIKEGSTTVFPFDPTEIAENLRGERYLGEPSRADQRGSWKKKLVRDAYYLVRPLLPVKARKHLQRVSLRNWEQIPFPHWPVDTTVDQFHRTLLQILMAHHGIEKIPFIWFWPDGLPGCAIMTHDVEAPAGKSFCDALMDLDDSFGIKSSFQVVPEERYAVETQWLRRIDDRGFEVNVHDLNHDGHLFDEKEQFLRRACKIDQYGKAFGAAGFRAGVLYRNQNWLPLLEFDYDMSVPNVGHLDPQRGGCCTVTPYFIGNLVELPVTCTQDYSLFNILQDYSTVLWQTQIDRILAFNGMASFIVHPDYLMEAKARETYSELLAILRQLRNEGRVWMPLPRDVARWWRDRRQMQLVRHDESWAVEGPASDRARVAYARVENGQLRFEIEGRASVQSVGDGNI